jgi:cytochrome c oxidase subunit 4
MRKPRNAWRPPRGTLYSWLSLLTRLAATVTIAYLPIGTFNTPVALGIACLKAGIVAAVFMQLIMPPRLIVVFAGAGFYWLGILLWLAFADYLTRSQFPALPVTTF